MEEKKVDDDEIILIPLSKTPPLLKETEYTDTRRKEKIRLLIFRKESKKIKPPPSLDYLQSLSTLHPQLYLNLYDFIEFLSSHLINYVCIPLEISSDVILSILPNDPSFELSSSTSSLITKDEQQERLYLFSYCKHLWLDILNYIEYMNKLATGIVTWSYWHPHYLHNREGFGEFRRKETLGVACDYFKVFCSERRSELLKKINDTWPSDQISHVKRNRLVFDIIEKPKQ